MSVYTNTEQWCFLGIIIDSKHITLELDELSTSYVKLKDLTPKLSLFLMHMPYCVCVGKYMYVHACSQYFMHGTK